RTTWLCAVVWDSNSERTGLDWLTLLASWSNAKHPMLLTSWRSLGRRRRQLCLPNGLGGWALFAFSHVTGAQLTRGHKSRRTASCPCTGPLAMCLPITWRAATNRQREGRRPLIFLFPNVGSDWMFVSSTKHSIPCPSRLACVSPRPTTAHAFTISVTGLPSRRC